MPELKTKNKDLVCFECGVQADHAHHVVPRVLGGTKTVNLCAPCHSKVHSPHLLRTSALTKAALKERRDKGLSTGGVLPFGFNREDGKITVNKEEQKIIKEMVNMREEGKTHFQIANHFADKGLFNRRGEPFNRLNVSLVLQRARENG